MCSFFPSWVLCRAKRQSRARGGLNRRNIRLRICFFRPPLAPPNLGGEIITPAVHCTNMSNNAVNLLSNWLTMQRYNRFRCGEWTFFVLSEKPSDISAIVRKTVRHRPFGFENALKSQGEQSGQSMSWYHLHLQLTCKWNQYVCPSTYTQTVEKWM